MGFFDNPGFTFMEAPLDFSARWDTSESIAPLELSVSGHSMDGMAFLSMKLVGHFWSKPIPRDQSPRDVYLKSAAHCRIRVEWPALPGVTISEG